MKIEIIAYEGKYYKQVKNLKLKKADRKEVEASNGLSYKDTMRKTVDAYSDSMYLIMYKGTVSGIFGVVPSGTEGTGIGYLLTDKRMSEYRWDIAKYSRNVFHHLLGLYPTITNYVSSKHTTSVKWLLHFGAHFEMHDKTKPKGYLLHNKEVLFYKFEFRKEDYYDDYTRGS